MIPLKKILLISLFALVSIGMAFGIYFLFFRAEPEPPIIEKPEESVLPVTGLPDAEEASERPTEEELLPGVSSVARGGLTLVSSLTEARAIGASLSVDGKTINYYNRDDGKFYSLTSEGDTITLSDKTFHQVQNVTWSSDKNTAVLEYPDGSNIIYNFRTETQTTLPKHWQEFDFSPDDTQIVAKSLSSDPTNNWLVAVDADGANMQTVELLGNNANKVHVNYSPNGQVVAFSHTGEAQGFSRQDIILIGMHGENFKALRVDGLGFHAKWSKTGDRLLYDVHNADSDYKPMLWISDASGENIGTNKRNLGLNTWADKCAFASERILYCAVPQTLSRGAGFQPATADKIPDVFYRVDTSTGIKTMIASTSGDYTAENLMVSSDGQYLFFTEKQTGVIEKIQLR